MSPDSFRVIPHVADPESRLAEQRARRRVHTLPENLVFALHKRRAVIVPRPHHQKLIVGRVVRHPHMKRAIRGVAIRALMADPAIPQQRLK